MQMRKTRIETLIKANVGWTESDMKFLEELDDTAFDRIAGNVQVLTATQTALATLQKDVEAMKANMKPAPKNVEEFIMAAPAEFQGTLRAMQSVRNTKRAQQIETIKANKSNSFSDDDLKAMSDEVLAKIAELAVLSGPDYSGMGGMPKVNAAEQTDEVRIRTNQAPPVPSFPCEKK
jgi:isopentenyl diphosphate isomerase/L-lactate dehydrogenase-like FMN-dependent dehydrogenase